MLAPFGYSLSSLFGARTWHHGSHKNVSWHRRYNTFIIRGGIEVYCESISCHISNIKIIEVTLGIYLLEYVLRILTYTRDMYLGTEMCINFCFIGKIRPKVSKYYRNKVTMFLYVARCLWHTVLVQSDFFLFCLYTTSLCCNIYIYVCLHPL